MTSDIANAWTTEDKQSLESRLLMETSEPLCLDPSPAVFHASARLGYDKHKLSIPALRRSEHHNFSSPAEDSLL